MPMDNDKLICFIYILGRDYLPLGSMEEIMKNHVEKTQCFGIPTKGPSETKIVYSNKYLEEYARSVSDRLING